MAAQAKLMSALKKKPDDDDDAPRPPPPNLPPSDRDTLKLRKASLLGVTTWEELDERLAANMKGEFAEMKATVVKMFGNILANPAEPKYRKIRHGNPNFTAKVYGCKGAPELFSLAGFKKDTIEPGHLVLPESADLALLERGVAALEAHAQARSEGEEKKRKLDAERAAKAREDRALKAREEANPAAYDAAVAGASSSGAMEDEDEAMVEAIEEWMDSHPEAKAGRPLDAYSIERQVAGPGSSVVVSVAASAGTQYYDYLAYMKRSEAGAWSVSKVVDEAAAE